MTEESIHDLRVGLRRLQAIVEVTDFFLPDAGKTREALDSMRKGFGPIRDIQVLIPAAGDLAKTYPVLERFRGMLVKREQSQLRQLRKNVKTRHSRLKRAFSNALNRSQDLLPMFSSLEIDRTIAGAIDSAYERVLQTKQAVDRYDTSAIHSLRIAFKKFRYATEAAQDVLRDSTRTQLERMHEIQITMGNIQDAEVLFEALAGWGRKRKKNVRRKLAPVYVVIAQRRREHIDALLARIGEIQTLRRRPAQQEGSRPPVRLVQ